MKKLLIAALLSLPLLTIAQEKVNSGKPIYISKTLTAQPGEVYLDSVKIDRPHIYLDPDNILETKVFKAETSKADAEGATLITRKLQGDIIPLKDFIESLKAGSSKIKRATIIKLMVNDKYVTDPENYRIELSSVRKVSIFNFRDKDSTNPDATASVLLTIKGFRKKE
ncbi:hypothetical protein Q765_05695 [Flavobacterium rivuli WB 3.3-2 = DSM 21788]|uniref:Uncharacterized protein n=1 Tax=Flavobacterium rivuli WB 3.3-2 = DSM 21788 TaxID=1121895 RepID=A0A0A2M5T5_9FLAO|nr:hypothetical protein [Flavobacterium rivuli]KGO87624.1 hypothetical protein Q765_05695 [Flavobacterium rivuli WB 3.3-2 = DSM 21788]